MLKQVAKWLPNHIWVFEIVAIAMVAYFLANATGEIFVSKLISKFPLSERGTLNRLHRHVRRPSSRKPNVVSGEPILRRNIFDSRVGPIDRHADEKVEVEPELPKETTLAPCLQTGLRLLATVVSDENEALSFATISEGNKKRWYQVGDTIGEREIAGISWRYLLLEGPNDYCYIDIFGDENFIQKKPKGRRARARWLADLKKEVKVVGKNQRVADRHVVNQIMSNPTAFIRNLGARPRRVGGRVVGYQLRRVHKRSPMTLLGLQRKDVVRQINGIDIKSKNDLQKAYQQLRSSSEVRFAITRRGKPVNLSVSIQ